MMMINDFHVYGVLEFVSPRFENGMLFSIQRMQKSVIVCFADTNFMCLVSVQNAFLPP